jgi:hypothetical protein
MQFRSGCIVGRGNENPLNFLGYHGVRFLMRYRAWCEAVFLVYELRFPALCTEIEATNIAEEYIGATLGALLTLIVFVAIVNSSQRL